MLMVYSQKMPSQPTNAYTSTFLDGTWCHLGNSSRYSTSPRSLRPILAYVNKPQIRYFLLALHNRQNRNRLLTLSCRFIINRHLTNCRRLARTKNKGERINGTLSNTFLHRHDSWLNCNLSCDNDSMAPQTAFNKKNSTLVTNIIHNRNIRNNPQPTRLDGITRKTLSRMVDEYILIPSTNKQNRTNRQTIPRHSRHLSLFRYSLSNHNRSNIQNKDGAGASTAMQTVGRHLRRSRS